MVRAVAVESNQDVEQLRTVLGSLEQIRSNLKNRLDLVEGQIDSTSRLIAAFSGTDGPVSRSASTGSSAPVRDAILKQLNHSKAGVDVKEVRRDLVRRFGETLHPKSHYGVLKRLADEGLAEREGSVWTITAAGTQHLQDRKVYQSS